ncbi:membrane protein insertion efficiency factor YidD [Gammaproteobacteria bacterium]|nr:membrane protein insertion efficiency factor YidD [Gammaproteobacteria bacterium]
MKRLLLTTIRVYQLTLSVFFGPRCRFYPNCSTYSSQAIDDHGVIKGLRISAIRILKCHPFHPGGYDPVPSDLQFNAVEKEL